MTEEYRAKVFKSGNSVALRLPKALGIKEGVEVSLREDRGTFCFVTVAAEPRKIDLTGIYGSIPGLERLPEDVADRDWRERDEDD